MKQTNTPTESKKCDCKCICHSKPSDYSWCPDCVYKHLPKPFPIELLNLAKTTTSRNELRETEKEIMIENKINEIINYLAKQK